MCKAASESSALEHALGHVSEAFAAMADREEVAWRAARAATTALP